MPRALVVTHVEHEGPGLLAEWLPEAGLELDLLRPWAGDEVPEVLEHDALVVMGGPQQAYDDGSAPWLRSTKALLASAVRADRPVLGICLGAQLLAQATGGHVQPGEEGPELGARLIAKRDAAASDVVMGAVPFTPVVVQWHWDAVVELPPTATLLASSTRYSAQVFRVGASAYGFQPHVEVTPELVRTWAELDVEGVRAAGLDEDALVEGVADVMDELAEVWRPAVHRWAALAA